MDKNLTIWKEIKLRNCLKIIFDRNTVTKRSIIQTNKGNKKHETQTLHRVSTGHGW